MPYRFCCEGGTASPVQKGKAMRGITNVDVQRFKDLAGSDLLYVGVKGSSRFGNDIRTKRRTDLLERQDGICPVCGESGTERGAWEFNHVVARGPKKLGFMPGNIFAGHSSCNAKTKPTYVDGVLVAGVEVLWVEHFARPDLIPTEWTPAPVLRAM